MLDSTLAAFDLRADIELNLMQEGQHPSEFLGRLLLALPAVMHETRPDIVAVQGDTATVMGTALAAFLCGAQAGRTWKPACGHATSGRRSRRK